MAVLRFPTRKERGGPSVSLDDLRQSWLETVASIAPHLGGLRDYLLDQLATTERKGRLDESDLLEIVEGGMRRSAPACAPTAADALDRRLRRAVYEYLLAVDAASPEEAVASRLESVAGSAPERPQPTTPTSEPPPPDGTPTPADLEQPGVSTDHPAAADVVELASPGPAPAPAQVLELPTPTVPTPAPELTALPTPAAENHGSGVTQPGWSVVTQAPARRREAPSTDGEQAPGAQGAPAPSSEPSTRSPEPAAPIPAEQAPGSPGAPAPSSEPSARPPEPAAPIPADQAPGATAPAPAAGVPATWRVRERTPAGNLQTGNRTALANAKHRIDELLAHKKSDDVAALVQQLCQEGTDPDVVQLALDTGDRCRAIGRRIAATSCYVAALRADPLSEPALGRLAELCIDDQEIDLAVAHLERIAQLARLRGDEREALRVYRRIVTIAPHRDDLLGELMRAHLVGDGGR